jgi:NADH-quinone oxidoreductase E subunit
VAKILDEHKDSSRDKLIPILQEVQEHVGYISKDAINEISEKLNIPTSKIYGVASFYNQFRFQPKGKHTIQVCRGTACHVQNSIKILEALKKQLKVEPGNTTKDGLFTLEVVACIGACGLAPVISIDGEFYAQMTPEKIGQILGKYVEMRNSDEQR